MKHSPVPHKCVPNSWKDLYMAALFETDKSQLPKRIAEARAAINLQRKKLFISANNISDIAQERQVLDNALFSLQALASCMALPPGAISANAMEVRVA